MKNEVTLTAKVFQQLIYRYSALLIHSIDLALTLDGHCCTYLISICSFIHCKDLAVNVNSNYCASKLHSALFCSFSFFLFFFLFFHSVHFLHFTDLALTLDSHFCASNLHSTLLCIAQTFFSLSTIINAYLSYIMLFLSIAQIYSSFHSQQSVLHIPAPFCSFYALHRPSSHSQQPSLCILALFCSFYAFHRPGSYSEQSLLRIQPPFCSFCASDRPFSHSQQSLTLRLPRVLVYTLDIKGGRPTLPSGIS